MKYLLVAAALLAVSGCGEEQQAAAPPAPVPMTAEAVGRYCGMALVDHAGPKGQAWVAGLNEPYWFSSARDAIAFTMLPEEPNAIAALYVSDMATSSSWERPDTWVEARKAHFVIGSDRQGGMGQAEVVPFSDPNAAKAFAERHGGTVATFDQIPREYVLGDGPATAEGHSGH